MTIKLITGIPGSGKTLFAVSQLKKELEKNQACDTPRQIYCDITGLKIHGIEPPPLDWRLTPPNSLLIYDEAQFHQEFKANRGNSQYKAIEELTIHRKTGHEIWFITQDPKRLHNDILAMVEQHYHLDRPYGAKLASIYQYRGAEKNPTGVTVKQRAENKQLFAYDKSLYQLYESSQVNDGIKMRLPRELVFWGCVLVATLGGAYYFIFGNANTQDYIQAVQEGRDGETSPIDAPTDAPPQDAPNPQTASNGQLSQTEQTVEQTEQVQVRGVIKMGNKCSAYNKDGMLLELTKKDCDYYIAQSGRVNKSDEQLAQEQKQTLQVEQVSVSNAPSDL